jgi:hypothetical protein
VHGTRGSAAVADGPDAAFSAHHRLLLVASGAAGFYCRWQRNFFPEVSFRSPPTRIGCPRGFAFEIISTMSEHFSLKCRFFFFCRPEFLFRNDSNKMLDAKGSWLYHRQCFATRTFFAVIKRTFCRILRCGILRKEPTVR